MRKILCLVLLMFVKAVVWAQPEMPISEWQDKTILLIGAHPDDDSRAHGTLAQLRENGKCILFSTHIMREAERLCDRVAIMHRGRVLAEGSLDELREQHDEPDLEELFF